MKWLLVLLALTGPVMAQAQQPEPLDHNAEDFIGMQPGHAQIIGPPPTKEELKTIGEALLIAEQNRGHNGLQAMDPSVFQQIAWIHLIKGGALRAGDFSALHGALLSANRPDTYNLAKKWEGLMDCMLKAPSCVGY